MCGSNWNIKLIIARNADYACLKRYTNLHNLSDNYMDGDYAMSKRYMYIYSMHTCSNMHNYTNVQHVHVFLLITSEASNRRITDMIIQGTNI